MSTLAIKIDRFSSKLWKHLIGKYEIENSYSHCRLSNGTIASEIITDVQTQGKYDSDTNDDVTHSMHTCTTHSLSHTPMVKPYRINRIDSLPICTLIGQQFRKLLFCGTKQ